MMQQASTVEQTRLEEDVAHEKTLKEQDAKVAGAFNLVELLIEELLFSVVEKKTADDDGSDFFSQDSPPKHLPPCSQDFAFFKAIEQTRDDWNTEEEEEESLEEELSPPSQFVY